VGRPRFHHARGKPGRRRNLWICFLPQNWAHACGLSIAASDWRNPLIIVISYLESLDSVVVIFEGLIWGPQKYKYDKDIIGIEETS
jgi:hypothetical protein